MTDKDFLKQAVELGKKSAQQGGFPAGAVIVKDRKVIAEGVSLGRKLHDPTGHGETSAIRNACTVIGSSDLSGATLYESLEACNMCFSVANWANISRIVYGCRKTPEMAKKHYYEGEMSNKELNSVNNNKIETVFIPDFEQEVLDTVKAWEDSQK